MSVLYLGNMSPDLTKLGDLGSFPSKRSVIGSTFSDKIYWVSRLNNFEVERRDIS